MRIQIYFIPAFGLLLLPLSRLCASNPSAVYLQQTVVARTAALGNFQAADTEENQFVSNPATLAQVDVPRIWIGHDDSILDTKTESAGFSIPTAHFGFGMNGRYISEGQIQRTANDPNDTSELGSFRPYVGFGQIGAAHSFNRTSLGVALSFWSEKEDHLSTNGWAANVGILQSLSKKITAALVRRNEGPSLQGYALPASWALGLSYRPFQEKQTLAFLTEYELSNDQIKALHGGVEYKTHLFALRIGHNDLLAQNKNDLFRFSLGAGLKLRGIQLDYAWQDAGDLGQRNIFTVGFTLGQTAEEKAAAAAQLDLAMNQKITERAEQHNKAGEVALKSNQADLAVAEYSQAIMWSPMNETIRAGLTRAQDMQRERRIKELQKEIKDDMSQSRWIDAAASLKVLQKMEPENTWAQEQTEIVSTRLSAPKLSGSSKTNSLFNRGTDAYINGHYDEALAAWRKVLSLDVKYPMIQEYIAKAQTKTLEARLQAQPKNYEPQSIDSMSRAAYTYYSVGNTNEAIALWQKILVLDPKNADAKTALEYARSRRSLTTSGRAGDTQKQTEELNRLALKEYSDNHPESALVLWRRALLIDPNNIRIKNNIERVENELATNSIKK